MSVPPAGPGTAAGMPGHTPAMAPKTWPEGKG